jgi:hypothetical protein
MSRNDEQFDNFSLINGYSNDQSDFSNYASSNILDADDSNVGGILMDAVGGGHSNAISGVVNQVRNRHMAEAIPPTSSPALTSFSSAHNNWRKRLRDMMVQQNENTLAFLLRPVTDHPTIGPAQKALRRFALRNDVEFSSVQPLRNILTDISGNSITEEEIQKKLAEKGPSSLLQIKGQVNSLIEFYKETGERLLETENQLKMRLDKMDDIQRRVALIMELKTNKATPELVEVLEKYLKEEFSSLQIESNYKSLLHLYQKHLHLREAIQVFKTANTLNSEPICAICIMKHVGYAIVPCGHTFCEQCVRRMNYECGICRTRIKERMKIFIS